MKVQEILEKRHAIRVQKTILSYAKAGIQKALEKEERKSERYQNIVFNRTKETHSGLNANGKYTQRVAKQENNLDLNMRYINEYKDALKRIEEEFNLLTN